MINRVYDVAPPRIIDELLRLYRLDKDWVQFILSTQVCEDGKLYPYASRAKSPTWLNNSVMGGGDLISLYALSIWCGQGPVLFRATEDQCRALEDVKINLLMEEYTQPYDAVMVEFPEGFYDPFTSCLSHIGFNRQLLSLTLHSVGNLNDITLTHSATSKNTIDEGLYTYDDTVDADLISVAARAQRVAANVSLALSHFGNHWQYLFPKEVDRDKYFAKEMTERGDRARQRIKQAVRILSFEQHVTLVRDCRTDAERAEPQGGEKRWHRRRGHWAMQAHGPQHTLRKRIFRPSCIIHKDRMLAALSSEGKDVSDVVTTYETR